MPPTSDGARAPLARFLRRNLIYIASALMDAGMGFCQLGTTYIAEQEFGASQARLGILALIMAGSYTIFCLVFGPLSDRWGRRRLIAFGAVVDIVALLLAAQAGSFWTLCAYMGIFSAGQGAFWPSMEADIGDHSNPRELTLRLGRFNVAWCLGFVIGWPLAGVIGQACGLRWVMVGGAILASLSLLACLGRTFEPEKLSEEIPDPAAERRASERAVPFWLMALVLNFAAMGLSNVVRSLMPAVTGGGNSTLGGIYGAVFFGAQVAVFVLLARSSRWHFRAGPMAAGALTAVGGALLCGISGRIPVFVLGCLLGGIGCGVAYFSSIYYSIAAATGKGHRGGIHEAVLGAGGGIIPLLGGMLATTVWVDRHLPWKGGVPFLAAGGFLALAAAVALPIYLRSRRR